MPYACKLKKNKQAREYRKRMPLEVRLRMNKGRAISRRKLSEFRQSILRKYKLLKGCASCGYKKHFNVLDFAHINKATKINSISVMVKDSISFKRIKDEVRKCKVLCANCHRLETYENKDWKNKTNKRRTNEISIHSY